MKSLLLFGALLFPAVIWGQTANFEDDFSDEDISDWSGNIAHFTFLEENGNVLLQQDAPEAGTSYLSIPSTNIEGYWEFFVRLDDFSPSGNNMAEIYLMSDRENLTDSPNGYMLQAGENLAGDVFRLFKITNGAKDGEILTGTTNISGGGDYRVKISRDASGNWILEVGTGYEDTLTEEDTGNDNTYSSASHFGFLTKYTATNIDNFAFDFKIEISPVRISSVSAINEDQIDVTFSKEVDFSSAQVVDFILNPGNITPQTVSEHEPTTARLTYSNSLPSGVNELTVSGIDDSAGETTLADTTLNVVVFDEYQEGDIIINEFLKDPPADAEEYVELKNTSSRYLNLKNWELGDNGNLATISTEDLAILPDSFIVISKDTASNISFFGNGNYELASLPAFNNGDDQIRLFDQNGSTIDSLEYNSAWGGIKVAIERRDPAVAAEYMENWGESPADELGTPGQSNQIQPDETPPEITELIVTDDQTLTVIFTERLESSSAQTVGNYSLVQNPETGASSPPLPAINSITQTAADTLEILLDAPLQEYDGTWVLEANNLTDIFGNSANDESEFNYYIIFTAENGQVAINEFMYDPAPFFSEFVELYNHSDSSFDLQDWTLNDNTGKLKTITSNSHVLASGKYVILVPDNTIPDEFPDISFINMASRFPVLNNNTDAIVIRNQHGTRIDSLTYSSTWGGDEISMERRTVDISAVYNENWGDSPSDDLATPGLPNDVAEDNNSPELAELILIEDNIIRLIFSERLQTSPAELTSNYTLNAESSFDKTVPGLQSAVFNSPDTVLLEFDAALPSDADGTSYELKITNQSDIFNNTAGEITQEFFVIEFATPDSGDVVINEFMYDPPDGFTDFVELYNPTDSAFNLRDWTFNDSRGIHRVISDETLALTPGEYLLLLPDSTIIQTFPGTPAIVMGNRFPSLNNTTDDAIVVLDSNGILIDSLTYSTNWGGNEISMERRSTDFPAAYRENWGDSPSSDLATPALQNEILPDNAPPDIKDISVIDDHKLRVIYTERVQKGEAERPSNYSLTSLSEQITPPSQQSLTFVAPDTVIITFEEDFPRAAEGTNYELTITNQDDIFGNTAGELKGEFFIIDYAQAASGEVAITEFMYDPAEEYSEFIEIFNTTDNAFNLRNWTYNDNSGNRRVISDANYALKPKSYVLLIPDSTILRNFPGTPAIVMGSRFSALNNSTDAIVIRNNESVLIDSLTYFSSWGGKEVSLERRSESFPATFRENWGDSPSGNYGTPGTKNEINPDHSPPEIIDAYISHTDSILILFNERIDSVIATDESNYSIAPDASIGDIKYYGNSISMKLTTSLSDGVTYTISVTTQEDVFGNQMESSSVELEYTQISDVQKGDVLVNEILYRRASADSPEFVELFNPTPMHFDLNNWTFSDASSSAQIPAGTQIRSGEYIILTDDEEFANSLEHGVFLSNFPSLNDDEDAVVVKNGARLVIDSLFYHESWGGNERGVSLERKDPESASNDASNWTSNSTESGTSVGVKSSAFQPDEIPPEIVFAKLQEDGKFFVVFSEFVNVEESGIKINDQPASIYQLEESNANIVIVDENENSAGETMKIIFTNIADFKGNMSESLTVEVSQPLKSGSVVINEILFDPLANSDDNLPDQTEYIELYNPEDYAISLEGFFLHDEPDEKNNVRSISPVSSLYKWIPSKGYVLVYADNNASAFSESELANYFEIENQQEQFAILINRSSLSLASSGDAIYFADSTGATIDSVFYDESWQNPNLHTTKGIALERIDPNGASDEDSNWSSSTDISGGTPGFKNSIYQIAGAGPVGTGINFTPNPFSPDDDGFDDNLFINYKLDESDYLLRIRIFDRYGREVRELANGKPAGFEGSILWDGFTDDRRKNRVGIYIVLFEAYNSANGKNVTFKETVVLARKF